MNEKLAKKYFKDQLDFTNGLRKGYKYSSIFLIAIWIGTILNHFVSDSSFSSVLNNVLAAELVGAIVGIILYNVSKVKIKKLELILE